MIGQLVTGDFSDNTMIFKMDGDITLQPGVYRVYLIDNSIEDIVCDEFNLEPSQLKQKTRKRRIVLPRQVIMHCDVLYNEVTFQVAAERYGFKHTSALHARNVINNLLETDKEFKKQFDSIVSRLNEVA